METPQSLGNLYRCGTKNKKNKNKINNKKIAFLFLNWVSCKPVWTVCLDYSSPKPEKPKTAWGQLCHVRLRVLKHGYWWHLSQHLSWNQHTREKSKPSEAVWPFKVKSWNKLKSDSVTFEVKKKKTMNNVLWGRVVTKYLIIYPEPRKEGRLANIVQHIREDK